LLPVTEPFLRAVILEHHHPDDPSEDHFDWLIEASRGDDPDERALLAFRVRDRPDGDGRAIVAQRIRDHRRLYLGYEGPLSGGRGEVRRVWSGGARARIREGAIDIEMLEADEQRTRRWRGTPISGERWRFTREGG